MEAPFWPRLAKGAVLLLLGAGAHQWLLPQQGARVVQVVQTGAPRPVAEVATPIAAREAAIVEGQDAADGPLALVPARAAATPAGDSLRLTPVGTGGVASRERTGSAPPASVSRSTPAVAVVSESPLVSASPAEEKTLTAATAPVELDTDASVDTATDALPDGESNEDESPAVVAATGNILLSDLTLASLPMARGGPPSTTDVADEVSKRETTPTRADNSEERVRRILQEYRQAYESLDVAAARTIWPSVDHVALTHAFRQLARQRLTFESCGISVSGASALARCRGRAEYIPKVGAQRALLASGEWVFDLARADSDWKIISASVH